VAFVDLVPQLGLPEDEKALHQIKKALPQYDGLKLSEEVEP
jgi:hypothetical protein